MTKQERISLEEETSAYDKYIPEYIIKHKEFTLLKILCNSYIKDKYYSKKLFNVVVNHTLDSYNCLKKGAINIEAKKMSIHNGIERIIMEYRRNNRKV